MALQMSDNAQFSPPPSLSSLIRSGPVALFLDFDGTLVPIADQPDAIRVPSDMAERLLVLADRLKGRLALVTGRALDDLERHTGSLEVARAGSHGVLRMLADGSRLGDEPEDIPPAARESLRVFAAENGLSLESKSHGAAVHYRGHEELEGRIVAFAKELAERHDLNVTRGKCVVEIVRPGANKGGAVAAFMAHPDFAGARPIFIGDDVTDEDGFAGVAAFDGLSILVGDREGSAATHRLSSVEEVHSWLDLGCRGES